MYETLRFTVEENVGWVRLAREARLNAINPKMVDELRAVVAAVRADESVRALVFIGAGRAFSAGADIAELKAMSTGTAFLRFLERIQGVYDEIEALDRPTIAALNGLAYGGGCELAIACDLRLMAESAKLGVPEILIGMLPGGGGTQRLPRLLPPAVAKQMIFFGEPLDAQTAVRHGVANAVVPDAELENTARGWAKRLSVLPPLALHAAKQLVRAAGNADLASGLAAERQAVAFLYGTEDGREGLRAFLEKRSATFRGR
ncbi:MAG: enoyl-CoA hydratase/isomerase family protein [Deltaproteobacteria bacterium]|nr:enoyl-CoA hydratase/isomerase family protein [Deltaproteobacteria bacterium]